MILIHKDSSLCINTNSYKLGRQFPNTILRDGITHSIGVMVIHWLLLTKEITSIHKLIHKLLEIWV